MRANRLRGATPALNVTHTPSDKSFHPKKVEDGGARDGHFVIPAACGKKSQTAFISTEVFGKAETQSGRTKHHLPAPRVRRRFGFPCPIWAEFPP